MHFLKVRRHLQKIKKRHLFRSRFEKQGFLYAAYSSRQQHDLVGVFVESIQLTVLKGKR